MFPRLERETVMKKVGALFVGLLLLISASPVWAVDDRLSEPHKPIWWGGENPMIWICNTGVEEWPGVAIWAYAIHTGFYIRTSAIRQDGTEFVLYTVNNVPGGPDTFSVYVPEENAWRLLKTEPSEGLSIPQEAAILKWQVLEHFGIDPEVVNTCPAKATAVGGVSPKPLGPRLRQ